MFWLNAVNTHKNTRRHLSEHCKDGTWFEKSVASIDVHFKYFYIREPLDLFIKTLSGRKYCSTLLSEWAIIQVTGLNGWANTVHAANFCLYLNPEYSFNKSKHQTTQQNSWHTIIFINNCFTNYFSISCDKLSSHRLYSCNIISKTKT